MDVPGTDIAWVDKISFTADFKSIDVVAPNADPARCDWVAVPVYDQVFR